MDYQLDLDWPDFLQRYWQSALLSSNVASKILLTHSHQMNWPG